MVAVFSRSQRAHLIRAFETVGQGDADDEGASGGFDDLMMTERNYGTNRRRALKTGAPPGAQRSRWRQRRSRLVP